MPEQSKSRFATRSSTVDGYTIDVRSNDRVGARNVILIHGIGVSMKYYQRLAETLADRYNVIALDLPGFGDTSKPPRALNLSQMAGVVAGFIKQQNIVRPIVVGQSMGCQIVARLANMPQLGVERLILISPTVNIHERNAPMQFWRLMQDTMREPMRLNLRILVDYLKFGPIRYLITQRYMIADEIERQLTDCSRPVLLVRGSRDKIVPANWVKYLTIKLAHGRAVVLKGAPHNLQYTSPRELATVCIDFIEQ